MAAEPVELLATGTEAWPVVALPTSFIVDAKGRIVYRAVGGREWDDPQLLRQIRELMDNK